jgi:hypothetical protein
MAKLALRFGVLADAEYPFCEPLQELKALINDGRMPRLCEVYGQRAGDCMIIARAIWADFAANAPLQHAWRFAYSDQSRVGWHYWLECSGWAFDLSHGCNRPAIVMRANLYEEMRSVEGFNKLLNKLEAAIAGASKVEGNTKRASVGF